MNRDVSAMQYMRAHGNSPGPTHRPYLTGAVSAIAAAVPSLLVRWFFGSLESEQEALGIPLWATVLIDASILIVAGMAYSQIFQRAANDTCGGWLFGISYGFLIWMLGPITIWQLAAGNPLAVGPAAIGIFVAQLVYGLILGGLFPFLNRAVQKKMNGGWQPGGVVQ